MGIKGKQSKKGEGEKELDGSVRDALLKVRIPRWKLLSLKKIASLRKISLTELINRILSSFLSSTTESLAQKHEDTDEG